ncbi:MAG: class II aldolase/adducin family protein [Sphaerochaetaceae bacterium]|jgi:L-fuculose-phosphate aldolase|nr:class II aldolase/adducin family protein [Sphaerochaetaceae bacterium]NLY06659.1 class II aldolase/adducin family protein [Spirochaetales bacterium]
MNIRYIHPADQLVMFMSRIYERGLTTTSGGNLSIRDDNGDVWITPAGVDKGSLTNQDIMLVKKDGTIIGNHRPSSELPFHLSVYRKRPDINAVLHAHAPGMVAFSIARKLPELDLIPTVRKTCSKIAIAAYAVPGSTELGENIAKHFENDNDIVIMENHGVCIGAEDMFHAFMKFETLEFSADLEILASKIGKISRLKESEIDKTETSYHKKMDDFVPHTQSSEELAARRDMTRLIHRSYKMGLFTATHGTYSVRLSDGSFLITPFGMDRAYLNEEDLVRVKAGMKEQGKYPSRAVRVHELIYQKNNGINAILIAHPKYAMAFAVTDAVLDPRTIPESYIQLRDLQKVPFGYLYSNPESIAGMFTPSKPALMCQNDCVIVTGDSLINAFDRLEVLESTAHSIINTHDIGKIVHITDSEIADLKTAFHLVD